jgi:hypothetical protein
MPCLAGVLRWIRTYYGNSPSHPLHTPEPRNEPHPDGLSRTRPAASLSQRSTPPHRSRLCSQQQVHTQETPVMGHGNPTALLGIRGRHMPGTASAASTPKSKLHPANGRSARLGVRSRPCVCRLCGNGSSGVPKRWPRWPTIPDTAVARVNPSTASATWSKAGGASSGRGGASCTTLRACRGS